MSTRDVSGPDHAHEQRRNLDDSRRAPDLAAPPASDRSVAARPADEPRYDSLFPDEETVGYRARWEAIQTGFVDQPRTAVEQADALVSELLGKLTDVFGRERTTLEQQWQRGQDNISTEDLRVALKRYRAFFDRLLSI